MIRSLPSGAARTEIERYIRPGQSNDIQLAEAGGAIPSVLGTILTQGRLEVDYFEEADFEPRVLAAAVRVGKTRLIDNVVLEGDPQ